MQTILIPTDFSMSSLDCIPDLCAQQNNELNLVFVHMFKLSDSMSDLLMLSRRSREYEYISDGFYQQCEVLKGKFPQICKISIEFFYGSTLNMFRNFLEAHEVDMILDAAHCHCSKLNKSSVDPVQLIKKCGLPALTVVKTTNKPLPVAPETLQMVEV